MASAAGAAWWAAPAAEPTSVLLLLALLDLALELLHHVGVAQRGDVAELLALGDVAQQAAHDLARAGLGQVVGPDDPLRPGELADALGDERVRHDRRLDLGRRHAVAGDVDHVVDAPDDPEVVVGVLARGVADEVRLLAELLEVRLDVAVVVAEQRAQHAGPRLLEDEQALLVALGLVPARLVENAG